MLPDLNAIPWHSLTHAYGSAEDVPELLQALSSPLGTEREAAFYALYGNIWHQGTVYEATAYAVPYLIALAAQSNYPDIPAVLRLLAAIAKGSSYNAAHEVLGIFAEQRDTAEWQLEKQQQLVEVERAHNAVSAGTPLYLTLTSSPDEEIQGAALTLLSSFPKKYVDIAPTIRALLVSPALFLSIPTALMTLGALSRGQDADLDVIAPYFAASYPSLTRFAAARAYTSASPQTLPAIALTLLSDALRHPSVYQSEDEIEFPYGLSGAALASLLRLPADDVFPIVVAALSELDEAVGANDCLAIMLACFGIAWFGDGQLDYSTGWRRDNDGLIHIDVWQSDQTKVAVKQVGLEDSKNLTLQQHNALAALLDCRLFWTIQTNALELFGLPTQREELAALQGYWLGGSA